MFPTGTAGAALFLLRISVAATLVANGIANWAPVTSFWILLAIAVPAILLSLGLLTPYFAAISGLIQLGILLTTGSGSPFHVLISILDSIILAVLGPGAYSIDARLFGRRILTVPPRR
jgi:hypothetical protein